MKNAVERVDMPSSLLTLLDRCEVRPLGRRAEHREDGQGQRPSRRRIGRIADCKRIGAEEQKERRCCAEHWEEMGILSSFWSGLLGKNAFHANGLMVPLRSSG